MPQVGEIKTAVELGKEVKYKHKYIWIICPDCKLGRWLRIDYYPLRKTDCCKLCRGKYVATKRGSYKGEQSPSWKGGLRDSNGYIEIKLHDNDFFTPMLQKSGYVMQHRLVMAKSLGRCLHDWEIVHHKNGDKSDNRIENLELSSRNSHILAHHKGYKDGYYKGFSDGINARIIELKSEVKALQEKVNATAS